MFQGKMIVSPKYGKDGNRTAAFDFVRSFAIFFVVIGHSLSKDILIIKIISPGLTMSVLGFISGYLLCYRYDTFDSAFYVKRFSRIYASLFVCLLTITALHLILSYDVLNQHSIIHFMGLSFFLSLLQVENQSSIGNGLWFITVINLMYLLLPIIRHLYRHYNARLHLFGAIFLCLFLNEVMYGTASAWNVIIAFNIGCYVSLRSDVETFTKKPFLYYLCATLCVLMICALSISQILPFKCREYLLPLYPFFAFPLLFKFGNRLNRSLIKIIGWFSSISYEVYILHFYFIHEYFSKLFPIIQSASLRLIVGLMIVLPLANVCSKIGKFLAFKTFNYLLNSMKNIQQG